MAKSWPASCLDIPMDRGARWGACHGVTDRRGVNSKSKLGALTCWQHHCDFVNGDSGRAGCGTAQVCLPGPEHPSVRWANPSHPFTCSCWNSWLGGSRLLNEGSLSLLAVVTWPTPVHVLLLSAHPGATPMTLPPTLGGLLCICHC